MPTSTLNTPSTVELWQLEEIKKQPEGATSRASIELESKAQNDPSTSVVF